MLVVLALFAMVGTALMAEVVFPHGTTDLDEVAYQTQANALREGHLSLDAKSSVPFFVPFLSGVRGDRVVFKYQPEWPAAIATSDWLFGSSLPLRMLCTAAGVLAVAWLGWEIAKERRVALLAAALALASPFTWVQGASLLGYQLSFVLGTGAAAALLRAARVRTTWAWALAGTLLGLAALHRPFDAALAVVPVLVYLVATARAEVPRPRLLAYGLGAAPFAAILLVYDAALTGNPLRLPYGVSGKADSFFFGWRSSFLTPGTGRAYQLHYTVARAWSTLGHDLALFPRFVALAPLVLFFAVATVWRHPRDPRRWVLVSMCVVVFGSYFFWWATANAALYGIDRALGPFYDYAALAPLCVLAAWGMTGVRLRLPWLVPLVAVAAAWAIVASWNVLSYAKQQGRIRTAEVELAEPSSSSPTLTLTPPDAPGEPYVRYANDSRLAGRHLTALDIPARRLELVARYPERIPFLVREYRMLGDPFGRTIRDRVQMTLSRATALRFGLHARVDGAGAPSVYLRIGDAPPSFATSGHHPLDGSWTVSPSQIGHEGPVQIAVGVTVAAPDRPAPRAMTPAWYECRVEARVTGDNIEALLPCEGWHHYEFPNGETALSHEDVSGVLDLSVSPS
jgi:hypothetical protein